MVSETASASAPNSIAKITAFFTLPRELRDEIYKHLLVTPIIINSEKDHGRPGLVHNPKKPELALTPQLLLVNKKIQEEASRILYGKNQFNLIETESFNLTDIESASAFVTTIGPENARNLRHVIVDFPLLMVEKRLGIERKSSLRHLESAEALLELLGSVGATFQSIVLRQTLLDTAVKRLLADSSEEAAEDILLDVDARLRGMSDQRDHDVQLAITAEIGEEQSGTWAATMMRKLGWQLVPKIPLLRDKPDIYVCSIPLSPSRYTRALPTQLQSRK